VKNLFYILSCDYRTCRCLTGLTLWGSALAQSFVICAQRRGDPGTCSAQRRLAHTYWSGW